MNSIDLAGKEVLEDMIHSCLSWLPEWIAEYRNDDDLKKMWQYENAEDFVLGLIVGMIYAHFEDHFVTINRRELNRLEEKEVMTTILLRTPKIRKALFGTETEIGTGTGIG
jgi:hypothetical protein